MIPVIDSPWEFPDHIPSLPKETIHLWRLQIVEPEGFPQPWRNVLNPQERARADQFRRPGDRERFLQTRAFLRLLLGAQSGVEPQRIPFADGRNGKPILSSEHPGQLEFNVSHSGEWGLIALSSSSPVGVDVEIEERDFDPTELAERFLPADQQSQLQRLEPRQRMRAFLEHWTALEATVKTTGAGLPAILGKKISDAGPIRSFRAPMPAGVVAAVAFQGPKEPRWRLMDHRRLLNLEP